MDGEEEDSSSAAVDDAIDGFVIDNNDEENEVEHHGGDSDGRDEGEEGSESPPKPASSDGVDPVIPTHEATDDANDASLLNLTGLDISEITEATDLAGGGTPWKDARPAASSATSFLNLSEVSETTATTTGTNTATPDPATPSKLVANGQSDEEDPLATLSDASTRGSSLTPSERRFAASSADDGDGEGDVDGEEGRGPRGDEEGVKDDRPTDEEELGDGAPHAEEEENPFAGLSGPDGVPLPSWEDPAVAAMASSSMRAHDPRSESMQVEISSDPDVDQLSSAAPVVPPEEAEVESFQDAVAAGAFDGDHDGVDEVDADVDCVGHDQPPVLSWDDGTGIDPVDGDGGGVAVAVAAVVGGSRTLECSESMLVEVASEPDHDRLGGSSVAGGSSVGGGGRDNDFVEEGEGERDDSEPSAAAATEDIADDGMTPPSQSPANGDGEGAGDGTDEGVPDNTNEDDEFGDFGEFTAPSSSAPKEEEGASELSESQGGGEGSADGDGSTTQHQPPEDPHGDDFGDFGGFNDAPPKHPSAKDHPTGGEEGDGTTGEQEQEQEQEQDDFGDFGSFEDAAATPAAVEESSAGDLAGKDEPQPLQSQSPAVVGADDEDDEDFGDFGTFSDEPSPPSAPIPAGVPTEEPEPSPEATAGPETTSQPPAAADDEEEDFGDFGDFGTFEEAPPEGPKRDATEPSSPRQDPTGPEKSTTPDDDDDDDDFGDFGSFSDAPPSAPPSSSPPAAQRSALENEGTVPSGASSPERPQGADVGLSDEALMEGARRVFETIFSPLLPPVSPEETEQSSASREFSPVSVQDVLSSLNPTVEGKAKGGSAPWSQTALMEYLAEVSDLPDAPASVIVSDNTSRHVSSPPPLLSQVDLSVLEKPAAASSNGRSAASKAAGVDGEGKKRVSSSERRRGPTAGDEKLSNKEGKPDSELSNGNKATIKTAQEFLDSVPDMSFMLESKLSLPPGLDDPSKAFDL